MLVETSLIETIAVAYIDHRKLVDVITENTGLEFTDFMNWSFKTYGEQYHTEGNAMLLVPATTFLERYAEYFELDEYDATEEESEEAVQSRAILNAISTFQGDINIIENCGVEVFVRF